MREKYFYIDRQLAEQAKDKNDTQRFVANFEFATVNNGVGILRVVNTLTSERSWLGIDYKSLAVSLELLESSSDVDVIALDINSPGGDVNGLFDFCEQIRNCEKPVYAFTSGMACSAAYAIASTAQKIFATESASIGSIGVFCSFLDDSEMWKKNGIKEISFYGKNSENKNIDPNSEKGKKVYQARVDKLEEIFISNIAKYRGISTDDVLDNFGHGQVFLGNEAKDKGLIDEIVGSFDEYIESIKRGGTMAENKEKVLATSIDAVSPELLESIKAEAVAKAKADAEKEAEVQAKAAVEKERVRVATLNEYAALPQPEIKALAEKAIKDGTSLDDFKAEYDKLAFKALKKAEKADTGIITEVKASTEIGDVNTGSQTDNNSLEAQVKADAEAIVKAREN